MGTVIRPDEILLNSIRYKTVGRVTKSLLPNASVKWWLIKDQTRGMGKLERKSEADDGYCWWTNCDVSHAGHMVPPPLAVAIASTPIAIAPDNTTSSAGWTNPENAIDETFSTAATANILAGTWSDYLRCNPAAATDIVGIMVLVGRDNAEISEMDIGYTINGSDWVGITSSENPSFTHMKGYPLAKVTGVTGFRIRFKNNGGGVARTASVYEFYIMKSSGTISTLNWCNFNSNTYVGINQALCKVKTSTGATLDVVTGFPANITDLVSTVGSNMAILLGDDDEFWYMNTSEVTTETDETGAYYGVDWDNKFAWIDSAGAQLSHCTALSATPAETDSGTIPAKVTVRGLDVYQDAAGSPIIYARTNTGLYAHDNASTKFTATQFNMITHTSTGLAGLVWNGGYNISQGLSIKRYEVGNYNSTVSDIGLDAYGLDGIPEEYNAHIVDMIPDGTSMYAIYDSTKIGSSTRSWIGKKDINGAWTCFYDVGADNYAMNAGIISDVFARRLWFDCNNGIYYIPLASTRVFPKLDSSSTYTTGAVLYSPWFEGDTTTFARTFAECVTYARSCSATETITITYRTNRSTIGLDISPGSSWTALATLNDTSGNGRVSTLLASGAGVAFNAWQFKIVLACTSPAAPDLQGIEMKYIDNTTPKWAYSFVVSLAKPYNTNVREQIEDDLKTAAESTVLIPFQYRDRDATTDVYVKVASIKGMTNTGQDYKGDYEVTVIQP